MNCGHITGAKPCGVIVGANACLTIGPCAAAGSQSGAIVSDRRSSNQSALMPSCASTVCEFEAITPFVRS